MHYFKLADSLWAVLIITDVHSLLVSKLPARADTTANLRAIVVKAVGALKKVVLQEKEKTTWNRCTLH